MKVNFSLRRLAQSLMWRFFGWSSGMRFRLRSGLEVAVADRNEMATFREIFIQQEYEDFLDLLPPPAHVLDLGCNSGYFAVLMLNRARILTPGQPLPNIVLVDANPEAVERARKVVSGCGCDPNVTLVAGLVGSRESTAATFYVSKASAESSAVQRPKGARAIQVAQLDLEKLVTQHFPNGIDLMKCDIEGAEESLVREWADVLKQTKAFLVEWHGFGTEWQEFSGHLNQLGFDCVIERPAGKYKNALFLQRH
jgi:FkbM family methyltransferase